MGYFVHHSNDGMVMCLEDPIIPNRDVDFGVLFIQLCNNLSTMCVYGGREVLWEGGCRMAGGI